MHTIKELQDICHGNAYEAGWWIDLLTAVNLRDEVRNNTRYGKALVSEKLALIHSETSEALEGHRKGLMDDKLPRRKMIEVEMADTVIRILDLCGALELDLQGAIEEKLLYNSTREDHKIENRMAKNGKSY